MKTLFAVPLVVGALTASAGAQAVEVGDTPDYSLKSAFNTMGVSGAKDLRGKPVLIDFWGTR